jgi:tricorn protease
MKKILCILLLPALLLAAIPGRFMEYPDIRNDLITFSYEGDLWRVSSQGGLATRLTVHPGTETAGRISPTAPPSPLAAITTAAAISMSSPATAAFPNGSPGITAPSR